MKITTATTEANQAGEAESQLPDQAGRLPVDYEPMLADLEARYPDA